MRIKVQLNDAAAQRSLARLVTAGTNLTPLMRVISAHLQDSAEQSFEKEQSPDGKPWAKLSPVTVDQRKKKGYVPIKILTQRAHLARSILADWTSNEAIAGTNVIYAGTHQFGAKQGAFGTSRRGSPIPWGNIPARPFLGVSPAHNQMIVDDVIRHMHRQIKP